MRMKIRSGRWQWWWGSLHFIEMLDCPANSFLGFFVHIRPNHDLKQPSVLRVYTICHYPDILSLYNASHLELSFRNRLLLKTLITANIFGQHLNSSFTTMTNTKRLNLEQKCVLFQTRVQLTQCAVNSLLLSARVDNHYYYQPDNLTWLHTTNVSS